MSYRVGTTHYNLPQTESTDKRDWFDTNDCFATIDSVLHTTSEIVGDTAENVETLQQEVVSVKNRVSQCESDIIDVKADIDTANESIGTLNTKFADNKQDIYDMICAYQEQTAVSTRVYREGSFFIYNDTLWRATSDIQIGTQIVPDTNCKNTTLTEVLIEIINA